MDEKSQIRALDRTAAILPMLPGIPERATHDYTPHGTSRLDPVLDITTGRVSAQTHSRDRANGFKKFCRLKTADQIHNPSPALHNNHRLTTRGVSATMRATGCSVHGRG